MSDLPVVTVLIPARNEAPDIGTCLAAVVAQDYPHDLLEVVVVDGGSTDETAAIAERSLADAGLRGVRIVPNPVGTTPTNLNLGLTEASGEILCRVDARTRIQPHYVRTCVEVLRDRPEVVVVGGAQIAIPRDDSPRARGISRALNNRWSMGGSRYRRGAGSGASDTVYLGAFRVSELRAAGGWDVRFETNQDFELNRRLGRTGVVWFDDRLRSSYLPRRSHAALWTQYTRFGRWKARYWRVTGDRPQARQAMMLAAPVVGLATVLLLAPRRGPVVLVGALLAVDHFGSEEPARSVSERVHAATAVGLVTGGWTIGAWSGLLGRR